MPLGGQVDLAELARTTFGFVGADLAALAREAAIEAVRHIMPRLNLEEGTIPPEVLDELRSEEHTSELQSLMRISYAVFCLKKKHQTTHHTYLHNCSSV